MITKFVFLCTIIRCFYLKYSTEYILSSDTVYRRNTSGEKKMKKRRFQKPCSVPRASARLQLELGIFKPESINRKSE